MKKFCTLKKENYETKPDKKTVYNLISTEIETLTETEYKNIIDSSPFFRRIGGSEYHDRRYTKKGYLTVRLVSKSPDKTQKTIRYFDFNL